MTETFKWWQKDLTSGDWIQKVQIGRGKSAFTQTYINGLLQESQIRVLNKKYWPHQFKMGYIKDIDKMERWCYNNLKSADWRNYGTFFAFKKQEDASYFLLMWT